MSEEQQTSYQETNPDAANIQEVDAPAPKTMTGYGTNPPATTDESEYECRGCFGEHGIVTTFFKMMVCDGRLARAISSLFSVFKEFLQIIFGKDVLYNMVKHTYGSEGKPLISDLYPHMFCCMDDPYSAERCCKSCCSFCCFPCISLYVIIAWILLLPIEIFMGVIQIILSILIFIILIFVHLVYKTEGSNPFHLTILLFWRGFSRLTLLNIIFSWCQTVKNEMERHGITIYLRLTKEDYIAFFYFINIFSLKGYLTDSLSLNKIFIQIPFLNAVMGAFQLVLGLVTLPFTMFITLIINTSAISWAEWSFLHIMNGAFGLFLIVPLIYYQVAGYGSHLSKIKKRCLNEDTMSYDCYVRSWKEYRQIIIAIGREINPYSMKYLFIVDGEMNTMDWMSMWPILGLIPFIFRVLTILVVFFACCFNLFCRKKHGIALYYKCVLFLLTGFLGASFVFTWVNYIIYRKRESVVKPEDREAATAYTSTA